MCYYISWAAHCPTRQSHKEITRLLRSSWLKMDRCKIWAVLGPQSSDSELCVALLLSIQFRTENAIAGQRHAMPIRNSVCLERPRYTIASIINVWTTRAFLLYSVAAM